MNRMEQEYMILWSRYSCRLVLSSIDFLRLCREKKQNGTGEHDFVEQIFLSIIFFAELHLAIFELQMNS